MEKLGYTVIQDWIYMLGLRLPETVCLSVIFGFCQDGTSSFNGSRRYLAAKLCSKDPKLADRALKSLISSGYVERKDVIRNNMTYPEYRVTDLCLQKAMAIMDRGVAKWDTPMAKADTTKIETRKNRVIKGSFENELNWL